MEPNKNVIMWLVLFPPLGVARVWTVSTWSKKRKILITVLVGLYFIATILATIAPLWYVKNLLNNYSLGI
ncbi:hypothetical protein KJ678_04220 [Patescibacteria group bacterium]|nr:hypothetical protein [Patescibacteria group bacterium]